MNKIKSKICKLIQVAMLTAVLTLLNLYCLNAQKFPSTGFALKTVIRNLSKVSVFGFAPDGRIFLVQQDGKVYIYKNGVLLPNPFLVRPTIAYNDRGFMGIAFDPDFENRPYVYFTYTLPNNSRNVVSRFLANGDVANINSEEVILELDSLKGPWHTGGALVFRDDGTLLVTTGDNSHAENPQNLNISHGKVLRINSDGSIPPDNPFDSGSEISKKIWSLGVRNPYSVAKEPATDRIYLNDVGAKNWEEINDVSIPGLNFGWPIAEGYNSNFQNPVYAYPHGVTDTTGNAITGGAFLSLDSNYPPEYHGKYFFYNFGGWINLITPGDSGSREVFAMDLSGGGIYLTQGPNGNLYYYNRVNNELLELIYDDNPKPTIINQPFSVEAFVGEKVELAASAIGEGPLTIQWWKRDLNNSLESDWEKAPYSSNKQTYTIYKKNASIGRNGQYRMIVTNQHGSDTSEIATIIFQELVGKPIANIEIFGKETYVAGDTVLFLGTGVDNEDGILPDSSYTWWLNFHHDTHYHDGPPILEGKKSGSFIIPTVGESSSNVFFRLILIVEDSDGNTDSATVDLHPKLSNLTFKTTPPGLKISYDGPAETTPFVQDFPQGLELTVSTDSQQDLGGISYRFLKWADGYPNSSRGIIIPNTDITYLAEFNAIPKITGLAREFFWSKNTTLSLKITDLVIQDSDSKFPEDFNLTILSGENYTVSDGKVVPNSDYSGVLKIPLFVNDGHDNSPVYEVVISKKIILSTDMFETENRVSIFPSPTNGEITLQIENEIIDNFTVTVFSLDGRIHLVKTFSKISGKLEETISIGTIGVSGLLIVKIKFSSSDLEYNRIVIKAP